MTNILISGGCGFMGSHFIKQIIGAHNKIVCVDKMTYAGNYKNLNGYWDNVKFFPFGIETLPYDFFKIGEFDIVVNFAAESHVDRSIRDPKAFLDTDVMGLFNLVYLSMKAGVKKFVHISTDEVYGPISDLCMNAVEDTPLNPTSPYSASKASGDLLLQAYLKTYDFPVVIVRPCNNYGPNQYPEKLIPMAITRLLRGERVILHGEGEEVREWIYVKDCVKAIEKVMNDGVVGEIYNIGSGIRLDNKEIITSIIREIKGDIDAWIEKIPNRPGNDMRYAVNNEKMRKLLGSDFRMTNLGDGMDKTIDWYTHNHGWWEEVILEDNIYKSNEDYLK